MINFLNVLDNSYNYIEMNYKLIINNLINIFSIKDIKIKISLAIFIYTGIFFTIYSFGWINGWSLFGISPMYPPSFADARNIQGAIFSYHIGLDPTISNPGDPWGRELLYPKTWIWFASLLHLNNENIFLLFIIFTIIIYCFICLKLTKNAISIVPFILSISSSSLLCIERGNTDLFIFNLIFFAISSGFLLSFSIIIIATLLKIYPLVGLFLLKRGRLFPFIMLLILAAIGSTYYNDITNINDKLPLTTQGVFGLKGIKLLFSQHGIDFSISFLAFLTLLSLIPMTIIISKGHNLHDNTSIKESNLFIAGVSIYAGLFVSTINFDYKLIFLIFCAPFISKFNYIFLKYSIYFLMILAFNFVYLFNLFGKYGVALSFISKNLLFCILVPIAFFEYLKIYHKFSFKK